MNRCLVEEFWANVIGERQLGLEARSLQSRVKRMRQDTATVRDGPHSDRRPCGYFGPQAGQALLFRQINCRRQNDDAHLLGDDANRAEAIKHGQGLSRVDVNDRQLNLTVHLARHQA